MIQKNLSNKKYKSMCPLYGIALPRTRLKGIQSGYWNYDSLQAVHTQLLQLTLLYNKSIETT